MTAYTSDTIRNIELDQKELDKVSGGTFTPNTYSKDTYHQIGICTSYNFFSADKFKIMEKELTESQANELVDIARRLSIIINGDYQGANKIGYSEPLFIQAFNVQLNAKYGIKWNGQPGYDY